MRAAGEPDLVVKHFAHHYEQLLAGATGFIDRREALPVDVAAHLRDAGRRYEESGQRALTKTAVAKLNGGLGTSMGMTGPKSLLPVKDGLTFLDVIIRQVLYARGHCGCRIPLLLMNSFSTHEATLEALEAYADFEQDVPIDFLQNMKPKIWVDTLQPAAWPADPDKEWCPPGHGDIYVSMVTSGTLDALLDGGLRIPLRQQLRQPGRSAGLQDPGLSGRRATFRSSWRSRTARKRTTKAATSACDRTAS